MWRVVAHPCGAVRSPGPTALTVIGGRRSVAGLDARVASRRGRREDGEVAAAANQSGAAADRTALLLRVQRTQGNHAATQAVGSLRRRVLQRSFASLEKDLIASVKETVKVIVPDKIGELDLLWKTGMKG